MRNPKKVSKKVEDFISSTGLDIAKTVDFIRTGEPISEHLLQDLQYDISCYKHQRVSEDMEMKYWELFAALIRHPYEINNGYWNSSYIATKLMSPKIEQMANKLSQKCDYVDQHKNYDDLEHECLIAIKTNLPKYDPNRANFPAFISPYLVHEGYIFGRDTSPYMEKVKKIERRQLESMTHTPDGENINKKDAIIYDALKGLNQPTIEEQHIENEHNDFFKMLCKLAHIELDESGFVTNFRENPQAMKNFVAATMFLGNAESPIKLTCLEYALENLEEQENVFEYERE